MDRRALRIAVMLVLAAALPNAASAATQVVFGQSWDGPANSLQSIIDARYGPGKINVTTDYIGAKPGDVDPWFWIDQQFSAFIVREVAGNANNNIVGWYKETESFDRPLIDGVNDAIVFAGPQGAGATTVIVFGQPTKFGFWLNPNNGQGTTNVAPGEHFYTNRLYNDWGPDGNGALHAPADGDVQALIFDVSRFTGANTWLVCFEDLDSGAMPGPCCATTDNDFNDFVFEVQAYGATPVANVTFGAIKAHYR